MFIYEPGAGCTGILKKVEPGEELHLSSWGEVNVTQSTVNSHVQSSMENIDNNVDRMKFSQMSDSQKTKTRFDIIVITISEYHLFVVL